MRTLIVIPARFNSTRLPGKPLMKILGKTMLERVVDIAKVVAQNTAETSVLVATDDSRILEHAQSLNVAALMTPKNLATGTDRVAYAVKLTNTKPDFIINLQGDTPLTQPKFLIKLIESFADDCDVITAVTNLSWQELEVLKLNKQTTPLSGTCALFNQITGMAYWFSKQIIPAIRVEKKNSSSKSPIFRHIGIYGYSYATLERFVHLEESFYEKLEGLEQLRLLENGYKIRCVEVDYENKANMSGVDSLEDIKRTEELLKEHEL